MVCALGVELVRRLELNAVKAEIVPYFRRRAYTMRRW